MARIRTHGVVTGRVQGVSFRASMQQRASLMGLGGWVRNLPDGSVEFEAEGEANMVASLVTWAEEGPAYARVDQVRTREIPTQGQERFGVR